MIKLRGILFLASVFPAFAMAAGNLEQVSSSQSVSGAQRLLKQVKSNRALRNRYLKHFGMSEPQLYRYITQLKLEEITSDTTLPVALEPFGEDPVVRRQIVPKGTFVFVDPSGNPALLADSGNPLFSVGPAFSEAKVVDPEAMGYYLIPSDSVAIPAAPVDLVTNIPSLTNIVPPDALGTVNGSTLEAMPVEGSKSFARNDASIPTVLDPTSPSIGSASEVLSPNGDEQVLEDASLPTTTEDQQNPQDPPIAPIPSPVQAEGIGAAGFLSALPWLGGSLVYGIAASSHSGGSALSASPVPEPISILILGVGAAALARRRNRS